VHLSDVILSAVRIRYPQVAVRIVAPLAIHKKAVTVRSGPQVDRCLPGAFLAFVQIDRVVFPVREVSH